MGGAEKERENMYELGFSGVRPVEILFKQLSREQSRDTSQWVGSGWQARPLWLRPSRLTHTVYSPALCGEAVTLAVSAAAAPQLIPMCLSVTQGGLASARGPLGLAAPPTWSSEDSVPAFSEPHPAHPRQWWEGEGWITGPILREPGWLCGFPRSPRVFCS